jgi:phosphoglycolate phosphatase
VSEPRLESASEPRSDSGASELGPDSASEPRSGVRAVLFDIDGTILVTGGAGGAAWQRAFDELHGVEANVKEHTDAGMTDPEIAAIIFREVIGREGSPEERAKTIAAYLKHLPDTVAESEGYRVMPDVEQLLDDLIDAGTLLGLVTGNIEAAAHIKLARAGFNRFFSFGGYGSDSADRTELTKAALRRAALVAGGSLPESACIAVGDTPRDVKAGHGAGIEVVGVATGSYSVEQLRVAGADWALETVALGFPA